MATSRIMRDMVVGVSWPVSMRKYWPLRLAMLGDGADGFYGAGIKRISGIFGDESAMGLDLRDAEELGEIGGLAKRIDAGGAGFWRDQSDGRRAVQEVPFERRRTDDFDRGSNQRIFAEQVAELVGNLGREAVDVAVEREKAVVEADVAHPAESGFRGAERAYEQAYVHWFKCRNTGGEGSSGSERVSNQNGGSSAEEGSTVHGCPLRLNAGNTTSLFSTRGLDGAVAVCLAGSRYG